MISDPATLVITTALINAYRQDNKSRTCFLFSQSFEPSSEPMNILHRWYAAWLTECLFMRKGKKRMKKGEKFPRCCGKGKGLARSGLRRVVVL